MPRPEYQERRPRQTPPPAAPARAAASPAPTLPDKAGRFEIRTPNSSFSGVRHNVQFQGGVGRTDDPTRAQACRELGYAVTELPPGAAGGQ